MDGRTDIRMDGRKISPFYRTLFPIRAAALPPPMKTKEEVEQGKGTADHWMPLGYLFFPALFLFFFFPRHSEPTLVFPGPLPGLLQPWAPPLSGGCVGLYTALH